jgi:hypothetical protein
LRKKGKVLSGRAHEDIPNDLEVEITDLDISYEGSKFAHACLRTQQYLARIPWKLSHASSLRILLFIAIFFVPLFISTSYGPERMMVQHSSSQSHCITRLNGVIIYDGTVTTSTTAHVTIIVITRAANPPRNGSTQWQDGKDVSNGCG